MIIYIIVLLCYVTIHGILYYLYVIIYGGYNMYLFIM